VAGIDLATAQAKLATWLAADEAVAQGQAHTIGNRAYTAADAETIRRNVDYWDRKCKELDNASGGSSLIVQNGIP